MSWWGEFWREMRGRKVESQAPDLDVSAEALISRWLRARLNEQAK